MGLEDAYLFLREFEEVCSITHFPNIHVEVVRMKLIHFALKDSVKRWMYGLVAMLLLGMILLDYS